MTNNTYQANTHAKPVWNVTHTCKEQKSGYAVEISTAPARGSEVLYSFRIGRIITDRNSPTPIEKFIPHIRANKDRTSMVHVGLETPFALIISTLLENAEEWIVTDMAQRHDTDIDNRIEKEQKNANFGKTVTKVTGKTERNRNKKRGAVA